MSLTLDIPDDVARALRFPPTEAEAELRKELAVALYARGALALGKARELAGLSKWEFGELLGRRSVTRHYGEHELAADLSYARSGQ